MGYNARVLVGLAVLDLIQNLHLETCTVIVVATAFVGAKNRYTTVRPR
jgi:hypothetical protein